MSIRSTQTQEMAARLLDAICIGEPTVVIWGANSVAFQLLATLDHHHLRHLVRCVVDDAVPALPQIADTPIVRSDALANIAVDVLVITLDRDKDVALRRAASVILGTPRVLLRGFSHLKFHDSV